MHIWEVTNENGQTLRFKADDISDLPCDFGFEDEPVYPVVKAHRVDYKELEEHGQENEP